jgi:hypothetical protein
MLDKIRAHFLLMLTDPIVALGAIAIVLACVGLFFFDHPLIAVGLVVGFILGMGNFYMLDRYFLHLSAAESKVSKAQISLNSSLRLFGITAIVICCFFISHALTKGIIIALLAVQFLMVGRFVKLVTKINRTEV